MNLFIDANIFLDFYHLTSTDLEELRKLLVLLGDGKIVLFVPRQIKDEISRNREAKIADALDKYKKDAAGFRVNFPAFTKAHQEFGEIRDLLKQANKKHAELLAKVTGQIDELELDADVLIRDLFKAATEVPVSNQCHLKAIERFRKGNPPGKDKNTIGDEINWEVLGSGLVLDHSQNRTVAANAIAER